MTVNVCVFVKGLIENKVIILKRRKSAFLPNNAEMLNDEGQIRRQIPFKGLQAQCDGTETNVSVCCSEPNFVRNCCLRTSGFTSPWRT